MTFFYSPIARFKTYHGSLAVIQTRMSILLPRCGSGGASLASNSAAVSATVVNAPSSPIAGSSLAYASPASCAAVEYEAVAKRSAITEDPTPPTLFAPPSALTWSIRLGHCQYKWAK